MEGAPVDGSRDYVDFCVKKWQPFTSKAELHESRRDRTAYVCERYASALSTDLELMSESEKSRFGVRMKYVFPTIVAMMRHMEDDDYEFDRVVAAASVSFETVLELNGRRANYMDWDELTAGDKYEFLTPLVRRVHSYLLAYDGIMSRSH